MQRINSSREAGAVSGAAVASVVLLLLLLATGSFAIWAFMNYTDHKNNVDQKVAVAVEEAKKNQKETDEKEFLEREKNPLREFKGPSDFGSISFMYPKTWSAAVVTESEDYEVAFNPFLVPEQGNNNDGGKPVPLRIKVESVSYTDKAAELQEAVTEGTLKATPIEVAGQRGTYLEGAISEGRTGAMVMFKVRDKTMTLAAEGDSFKKDFNDTIVKTLKFNP